MTFMPGSCYYSNSSLQPSIKLHNFQSLMHFQLRIGMHTIAVGPADPVEHAGFPARLKIMRSAFSCLRKHSTEKGLRLVLELSLHAHTSAPTSHCFPVLWRHPWLRLKGDVVYLASLYLLFPRSCFRFITWRCVAFRGVSRANGTEVHRKEMNELTNVVLWVTHGQKHYGREVLWRRPFGQSNPCILFFQSFLWEVHNTWSFRTTDIVRFESFQFQGKVYERMPCHHFCPEIELVCSTLTTQDS